VHLSEYGQILEKYIGLMSRKYEHISVDKYVIMPEHFHILLRITEQTAPVNGTYYHVAAQTKVMGSLITIHTGTESTKAMYDFIKITE
jgi:REP element-mobilizing transposase RayT